MTQKPPTNGQPPPLWVPPGVALAVSPHVEPPERVVLLDRFTHHPHPARPVGLHAQGGGVSQVFQASPGVLILCRAAYVGPFLRPLARSPYVAELTPAQPPYG